MSNVVNLPAGKDRSWHFMGPEFRKILIDNGVPDQHIEPILREMEGYHRDVEGDWSVSFSLDAGLNAQQAAALEKAVFEFMDEYKAKIRENIYTAHGIILKLLIEKHCGWKL